ncbi:FISUMP domain-containing protein [Fibrobacter sp. UWB11]|uniref:FISUMP domain-containing protein n=1 Tax=Fibrobacter sp. UWB11 TaxID=1896202 RepID=UPI00092B97AC|nr:FISUMP domain-containing protein [Fibrobacter sp. UWB11]SIO37675.1 major paralogous domain-containing protein [Fibrobacter sp. UWB11]
MHISQRSFQKAFFSLCLILPFYISACGSDDGSNATSPTTNEDDDDNLGGDAFKDTSITGTQYNSNAGIVNIIKSEILDEKSGKTYKTIQFGPYTWMAENANYKIFRSACYDEDTDNCKIYGRLYQSSSASQACPSGFKVPTEADFKYMVSFTNNIADPAFGFDPQMSGFCETVNGELQCSRGGKEAYYQTSDFNIFRANSKGKYDFPDANYSAYYALRCMKVSHFVENDKQLPICDSTTYSNLSEFFVASKGSNYRCNRKKWVEADDNSCPSSERGEKHYYKDSLYICNYSWELATMNDVDASCTKKNQWEVRKLNGQSYICDESTWRKPSSIESAIGLCTPDSINKMKSEINKGDTTDYVCDSTGWRKAVLIDYIGPCDSSKYYTVKKHQDTSYACRTTKTWTTLNSTEKEIGVCTPKQKGKIDSIMTKNDTTHYYCDSTSWRKATLVELFGKCDSTKYFSTVKFEKTTYACRKNNNWEKVTSVEDSLGFCTPDKKGKLDTIGTSSYYYCDDSGWRKAVADDYLGVCDSTFKYKMKYLWGNDYGCKDGPKWEYLEYPESDLGYCVPEFKGLVRIDRYATSYICDTKWRTATKAEALGTCSDENEGKKDGFKENNKTTWYVCAFDSWREKTTQDDSLGVCTKQKLKKTGKVGSTEYICTKTGWVIPTLVLVHDSCTAEREKELVQYQNKTYVCRSKRWTEVTGIESINGLCTTERENESTTYQEKLYVCRNEKWTQATDLEVEDGICTTKREGKIVVYSSTNTIYQCKSQTWTSITAATALGNCTETNKGETKTLDKVDFFCSQNKTWKVVTDLYKQFGECTCDTRGKTVTLKGDKYGCIGTRNCANPTWVKYTPVIEALGLCDAYDSKLKWGVYNGTDYICRTNYSEWETASTEWGNYGRCNELNSSLYGTFIGAEGQRAYCDEGLFSSYFDDGWYVLTALDSVDGVCTKKRVNDTISYQGVSYYCKTKKAEHYTEGYAWIPAPSPDVFFGACNLAKEGSKGIMNGKNFICYDGVWIRAPADYGSITDARDGKKYKTIKIGKQEWLAENLNYNVDGSWCGGTQNGCETFGRLYSWNMAVGLPKNNNPSIVDIPDPDSHQGICPSGWRLPTTIDWNQLLQECSPADLRKDLAKTDSANTDICGFSALPAGYINIFYRNGIDYTEELTISNYNDNRFFWSSEQMTDSTAMKLYFTSNRTSNNGFNQEMKKNGLAVRCIKK